MRFNFCHFRGSYIQKTTKMEQRNDHIQDLQNVSAEEGIKILVAQYKEPLYWYIRRMVVSHDDTDDVLQETFIRAYRSWKTFRGESGIKRWLYRIATNESLRLIEKRKSDYVSPLDSAAQAQADTYIDYSDTMAVNFQKALQTLPEKQRAVFTLRYYDEMDYDDIAEVAEMSVQSAKTNYSYATKKIKEFMIKNI